MVPRGDRAATSAYRCEGDAVGSATVDEDFNDRVPRVWGNLRGAGRTASFIEKPAGCRFGSFQLNAVIRTGSLAAAAVALVFDPGPAFPATGYLVGGLGIGLLTRVGSMLTFQSRWWSRSPICTS